MIPQNFKDIISASKEANAMQIIAMLLFMIFFLGVVYLVFNKPKKYYDEQAAAPLADDHEDDKFTFK